MQQYDLIVIGVGAGGLTAAFTALGFGKKVLLVEKAKPGGECTWSGCIPSKALINIAKQVGAARKLAPDFQYDSASAMTQVRQVIEHVYEEETPEKLQAAGADYVQGAAVFIDKNTVEVNGSHYRGKKFVVATGSSPLVPPIKGLDTVDYLTNESIFNLQRLPSSITVLGGGAIGLELAQAMNRLGVSVTVVEMLPEVMFREEPEFAAMLREVLEREGVKFALGMAATAVEQTETGIRLQLGDQEQSHSVEAEALLVAIGRRANSTGLGLEALGVDTDKGIQVNARLQTTVPTIYACGDVVGPYQFSHMANYQGKIAAMNALLPLRKKAHYQDVAWTTFTEPEFARAGLTEQEAREQHGDSIRVYEYDFAKLDRAKTKAGDSGKIKLITDTRSRVLGAHIIGERAGEMICEVQTIKSLKQPFSKLQGVIHPYPTYSDALRQLAQQVYLDALFKHPLVRLFKR